MPEFWRKWSLLVALPALLGGCYATAGGPYFRGEYYGAGYDRPYGYYAAPALVVHSRPAWGYAAPRVYAHERDYGGRVYHASAAGYRGGNGHHHR